MGPSLNEANVVRVGSGRKDGEVREGAGQFQARAARHAFLTHPISRAASRLLSACRQVLR